MIKSYAFQVDMFRMYQANCLNQMTNAHIPAIGAEPFPSNNADISSNK